jgi:DNA-binding response OmpR family regulator
MGIFDSLSNLLGSKQNNTASSLPEAAPLKKVLVVEDDKDLRDFYAELLTSEGFAVITAENGQLGLDAVTSQKPNLVLLDLMMPVMDGKTMLHSMREIPEFKTTPVIVLSNAGDADSIRQTKFFDNANDFLIKSNIAPNDLIQKIKTFI